MGEPYVAPGGFARMCETCGATVTDMQRHDRWHAGLRDMWVWVERVSGSSCELAREVLGAQSNAM